MNDTQLAAIRLTLEVSKQVLRETPALYALIEQTVRSYLKETYGVEL
jgi:hypothetical protein